MNDEVDYKAAFLSIFLKTESLYQRDAYISVEGDGLVALDGSFDAPLFKAAVLALIAEGLIPETLR